MLAKPQGFPRKLGGCAGLDPRLRSAVSAGVGDGERGLRRGLRAPGVGVRPKWVLEYSPSNKRIRYFVSITYVRTGLWTAHKFCGGGKKSFGYAFPEAAASAAAKAGAVPGRPGRGAVRIDAAKAGRLRQARRQRCAVAGCGAAPPPGCRPQWQHRPPRAPARNPAASAGLPRLNPSRSAPIAVP